MTSLQFTIQPQSAKTKIADALVTLLKEVSRLREINFNEAKVTLSDLHEGQLPYAQFIGLGEGVVHERLRARRTWRIVLEVCDKSDENGYVSQKDMWDLEYQISRKLWSKPQLGLPFVIQMTYIENTTDLHAVEPYYLLSLQFDVEYYENLTGEC